jgi:hypothetical protein
MTKLGILCVGAIAGVALVGATDALRVPIARAVPVECQTWQFALVPTGLSTSVVTAPGASNRQVSIAVTDLPSSWEPFAAAHTASYVGTYMRRCKP